jgi:hypothetical protein
MNHQASPIRRTARFRRIPSRRQWQRHRKRCAGDAQDDACEQDPGKALNAHEPDGQQADQHDRLGDQSGEPRLEMIDHDAEDHADHRAGEHGHGDHQALLRVVELQVGCDLDAERSEHDPDHERDVEVEERGEQRRRITGTEERLVHHRNRSRAPRETSGSK